MQTFLPVSISFIEKEDEHKRVFCIADLNPKRYWSNIRNLKRPCGRHEWSWNVLVRQFEFFCLYVHVLVFISQLYIYRTKNRKNFYKRRHLNISWFPSSSSCKIATCSCRVTRIQLGVTAYLYLHQRKVPLHFFNNLLNSDQETLTLSAISQRKLALTLFDCLYMFLLILFDFFFGL